MDSEAKKAAVAAAAIELIEARLGSEDVVGVGTGTTANHFIDQLAAIKHRFDGAVSSSEASTARLRDHGITVYELTAVPRLDWYVDGADESTRSLHLIKGGGGALTREKIVAADATTFVCIVDDSKLVERLGAYPLPVEVIPMARSLVGRALVELGGEPVLRDGFVTDNGNVIIDVHGLDIADAVALEEQINNLTGVVTCGLFARRPADVLLIAGEDGIVRIDRE